MSKSWASLDSQLQPLHSFWASQGLTCLDLFTRKRSEVTWGKALEIWANRLDSRTHLQEYFCCNVVARLSTCEGHKLSASNPQGPSLFLKGHLSSCTDFSKRTDMLQTQNPLSTDLKHCTNRSSTMRSKSHEQLSRTNITCLWAVLKMSVGDPGCLNTRRAHCSGGESKGWHAI